MHKLLILSLLIVLSSCKEKPVKETTETSTPLFENKIVEGTIVSVPLEDEIGFIEVNNGDHADSYLVMYHHADYAKGGLFEKVYITAVEKADLAFARTISRDKPEEDYHGSVRTKIRYHSFSNHGLKDGYHRVGHILGGSFNRMSSGQATVQVSVNNDTIVVNVEASQEANARNMADREVYMNIVEETVNGQANFLLTEVDTCHVHGDRIIDCLSSN